MAIYDVQLCGSPTIIEVEIESANINDIWYIKNPTPEREQNLCGIVTSISLASSAVYTGITLYNDCYECIQDLESALYTFTVCGTEGVWAYITPRDFGLLPSIGDVFYLTIESRGVIFNECVFFSGVEYDSTEVPRVFISQTQYSECNQCLSITTPRSGGTDYFTCVICCDCGSTASTINQVVNPHPVWTDGYGTEVTQLGMVTIGGNGLNS